MKINSVSEVADRARERFDCLASQFQGDRAFPVRLPPDDGLRLLVEEAFWASISRDEGRQCRFTVAYYGNASDADVTVALDPKPFERSILRRLAAVAFAADAEIAVSSVGDDLRIIGLCKRFRANPQYSETLPIEIDVRGPAHIDVRYGIFRVLTYTNGEIPEPAPNIIDMPGPFRDALDTLAKAGLFSTQGIRANLKSLFDQVDQNAHGGLLILSSTKPNGLESVAWPITNDVHGLSDIHRLQQEYRKRLELPKNDPQKISFNEAVRESERLNAFEQEIVELSASLALTDGGVWLDGNLCPRAFGVFVEISKPSQPIHAASDVDGTDRQEKNFDTLGSRHRAMVAFAGHNPGCPAIAVSIDGGYSAALQVKDRNEILVWRFQRWDLRVDDPFDPQLPAIQQEILSSFRDKKKWKWSV